MLMRIRRSFRTTARRAARGPLADARRVGAVNAGPLLRNIFGWPLTILLCSMLVSVDGSNALRAQVGVPNLTEIEIERLLNIEVTSAAKRGEPLFQTASAIFVITREDIRRSGATTIPDLLRIVPGLNVAQVDSSGWAVSSRGFAERYANKLLVLVDGRIIYDPLFAGVFWEFQNVMLEDIDRIEVIRGPGATLWGANAVNGVINILTRTSADTLGGLVTTTVGTREPVHTDARLGGRWGSNATYRISGSYFRRDHSVDASREPIADAWEAGRGGIRADWSATSLDSLTVQGEVQARGADESLLLPMITPPFQLLSTARVQQWGGNLLGRWKHSLGRGNDWTLQAYYDRVDRHTQALEEHLHTVDLDFQHHFTLGRQHDWVWGLNYRATAEDFRGSFLIDVPGDTEHRFSAFWQDEITIAPDRVQLTPGIKLERDPHSGWNWQPSVRLLWTPSPEQALWAAISRALRTPSDLEVETRINSAALPGENGVVNLVSVFGNKDFQSEKLLAYELGYRISPSRRFSLDLAAFYNIYHDLQTTEPSAPFFESNPPPSHVVIPQQFDNLMKGETYGMELAANWNLGNRWNLSAAYSRLEILLHRDPRSQSQSPEQAEGSSPDHQLHFRSHWTLPHNLELDTSLHHTSAIRTLAVPAYTRLDAQWVWSPGESASFAIGAQNLLSPRHLEFGNFRQIGQIGQAERNFYGKLTWRF